MPFYKDFLTIYTFRDGREIINRFFELNDNDIKYYSNIYNTLKNCYASVNYYYKEGETRIPIIEKAFFDIDGSPEDTKKLVDYLLREDIKFEIYFSGRGHHIYLPLKGKGNSHNLRILQYHILHQANANSDLHTIGDAFRVSRIPNTLNLSANKFCIPIKIEEIGNEPAGKQRFEKICYGERILDLGSFIEDNYTYIKEDVIKDVKINSDVVLLPCIKQIIAKVNPKHGERWLLAVYLSDSLRNGVPLINFDKEELYDKIMDFMDSNCGHWIDYNSSMTRYWVENIAGKFDISCGCEMIRSRGMCISCKK